MPNKPWSKAELKLLKSFENAKESIIPNRSKKSVRRKLLQLGIVKPAFTIKFHRKKAWTEDEINLLKSSKDPKKTKIPGHSKQSVICMVSRLGLVKKNLYRKPWEKEEIDLLKFLISEGKTPLEIFKMEVLPSHSRNSIQKKAGSLGLSKKSIQKKFTSFVLLRFKKFLKENWEGKTPEELVDLWNQNNSFKINKSKVVYHLYVMKIKISYKEVLRIKSLRRKEEEIKSKPLSNSTIDSLRSIRVKLMRQRASENKNLWNGLLLEKEEQEDFSLCD